MACGATPNFRIGSALQTLLDPVRVHPVWWYLNAVIEVEAHLARPEAEGKASGCAILCFRLFVSLTLQSYSSGPPEPVHDCMFLLASCGSPFLACRVLKVGF